MHLTSLEAYDMIKGIPNAGTRTGSDFLIANGAETMTETGKEKNDISPEWLQNLVDRIVRVAAPERIILFGSAARGDARADSDVDILVVKTCSQRRDWTALIYRALIGVGRAVDVVVATPDDLKRFHDSPATVIAPALRDGKVLYAA